MIGALTIDRLPRLSLRERLELLEIIGHSPKQLAPRNIEEILKRSYKQTYTLPSLIEAAAMEAEWLFKHSGGIIAADDQGYPSLLREIYDPPFLLRFRGEVQAFARPAVSVVGTRHPNGRGARSAFQIGEELGRLGISVVSGLALGIDRQAHAGNASVGAASVAVLGSGIAEVSPLSSRPTAERLLQAGGTIISEYPVFTPPARYRFPERNRIIAGLTMRTLIVQAPHRSGALITADYALDQGREVLVHADCMQPGVGDGTRELFENGARAVLHASELLGEVYPDCAWESMRERVS